MVLGPSVNPPFCVAGPVIRQEYSLEYGTDSIEMHTGAIEKGERVVVIDDLIATGGTLGASLKLLGEIPSSLVPKLSVHCSQSVFAMCFSRS